MNKKKNRRNIKKLEEEYKKKSSIKLRIFFIILIITFVLLLSRIAWIEFINGSEYKEMAYKQQTIDKVISPKRGTIYDSTGKALATSASVDTITINPTLIVEKYKESVTQALSTFFELDYNTVREKVYSNTAFQTIIKKVETDKVNQLKQWMKDTKISRGINIDTDSKRYYPYNTLASNLIGFCNSDNSGSSGIEYKWNSVLTGTPGRLTTLKGGKAQEIPDENQKYIPAENGSDIILSLDYQLQEICEKYLEQAVTENNATRGGNVIMMEPSTGDIKAMATYPNYNLNTPSIPITASQLSKYESLQTTEEKNTFLNNMWKNKAVSDTYEPGSTFKILTAAIGLEEGFVTTDKAGEFKCNGAYTIYDTTIQCWKYPLSHGSQSLREALENSCNPAFIQLGQRIGTRTLYKYYKAFGLFDKTGANLAGESNSIFYKEDEVTAVDLATMSFGQRFTITPLQLITAVSAIANDGVLMQPRVVKQVINNDTGAVTNIEPVAVRQVISKETATKMKDLLHSVVVDGTGRHAEVKGYSIGGKTGTSEPLYSRNQDGYTASYIAISPVENTQIVLLVTLYGLTGKNHQGGQVAGPVVQQIFSEALPILGIPSNSTVTSKQSNDSTVTIPDVTGKTIQEAEQILKNSGFNVICRTNNDKSGVVTEQIPKSGTRLIKNSLIILYDDSGIEHQTTLVPNLKGISSTQATKILKEKNLNIRMEGSGKVISQSPTYNSEVQEGTVVTVTLNPETTNLY